MRLSHQHRFVFLAYPRTASGTIRSVLDPYADIRGIHLSQTDSEYSFHEHMTASELKQVFDQRAWDWYAYRRFCVIRNPFSRLVSLFHRRVEYDPLWDNRLGLINNLLSIVLRFAPPKLGFQIFLFTRNPRRSVAGNLSTFIYDSVGNPLVDDILKFENLALELPVYLQQLGIEIDQIPRLNVSQNRFDYTEWYTDAGVQRVKKMYRYEIERFGYKFGQR